MGSNYQKPKNVNLLLALACEAKPLIDALKLKKVEAKPFSRFQGQLAELQINLLVTGLGSNNMASAVGWLAAKTDDASSLWVNVGSAGHASLPIGTLVNIVRVQHVNSKKRFYPHSLFRCAETQADLLSFDQACSEYPAGPLVDMEGAAFCMAAAKYADREMIQLLKVVSDNEENPVDRLGASLISDIVATKASNIIHNVERMSAAIPPVLDRGVILGLISPLNATVSQQHQFVSLCGAALAMRKFDQDWVSEIEKAISIKALLSRLNERQAKFKPALDTFDSEPQKASLEVAK